MKKKTATSRTTAKKAPSRQPGQVRPVQTKARSKSAKSSDNAFDHLIETGGVVPSSLKTYRFAGVSLAGGKTDKTAVAVIDYFPTEKRIFLRTLRERVGGGEKLADVQLHEILTEEEKDLSFVCFDVPLQLPMCVRCELKCPGYEKCKEPEIKWMWQMHRRREKAKRPNKMFTPYTERSAEIYIAHELEEPFHPSHALGSNAAPLTARAYYLRRRLHVPVIEAYPKLTLWRIGLALNIPKSYLRFHRHAVDSDEARHYILKTLIEKEIAFIYQQDLKVMVENSQAFDAFMCALTAFLKHRGQTEKPPQGFPKHEGWIEFPKQTINWF